VLTLPAEGPLPACSDGVPAGAPPASTTAGAPFAGAAAESEDR